MNHDDIMRMAREVHNGVVFMPEDLVRFAELIAAAERDACMKLCQELAERKVLTDSLTKGGKMRCRSAEAGARKCFVVIRARNKQGELK